MNDELLAAAPAPVSSHNQQPRQTERATSELKAAASRNPIGRQASFSISSLC
uniref:Uncharacterized protein n=1 Tax=Solanum tuberosum TaxID=4113 RepID=M1BB10_SOLTU